ncbi:hypothetical protein A3L04_09080 [Thermococcus chitonophagus]|uniref:Type III-B CRISPR module RAMP protein Cmr1 n=1 Tax=Thermococcus chitonophagus TaxID=54262 RepID=A0A2Z2N822_9EURY|nr:hypothetical protein A3L04_09080 [Thermococcus chitonophagus]
MRAASIKGAMRWWFRALAGNYFGNDIEGLKKAESYVFGSTERKSRVKVIVNSNENNIKYGKAPIPMVWKDGKRLLARCIKEKSTFSVTLLSYDFHALYLSTLSFVAMSFLGGIGFRSNRGTGSIKILGIESNSVKLPFSLLPCGPNQFENVVKTLLDEFMNTIKKFQRKDNPKRKWECGISCPPYSSFKCFSLWLWPDDSSDIRKIVREVCYSEHETLDSPKSLLGAFEKEFKTKKIYQDEIFGLPRPKCGLKGRRASPMKVGVVYLGETPYVRFSVFKTCPFSLNKKDVRWELIDRFLSNIKAQKIFHGGE